MFSIGGDDALNKGPKAIVNRFKPVVRFDGPFLLKKGKTARHTYQMPNYNGRVKIMVVAGNGEAYGHADKSVMVRKPVMLLGTLPRVIGVGEEMVVPATVFATEDGVGAVNVSIACSSNMEVVGETTRSLSFERKGDQQALFRIRVKKNPGIGKVTITAAGKGDKSVYETELEIRTVRRPQVKVTAATLEVGKSWKETVAMPGATGTNQLTLEVSYIAPVNVSSRLSYLLGYPHGCLEQITSKGFPQLYISSFTDLTLQQAKSTEEAVKEVIRRLRSYQTVDGAFAYWPGGTSSNGWGTVYATHFLLEASKKGYLVPEAMKQSVLNNLRRVARNWKPVTSYYKDSEEATQAYRLYVLALAGSPEMGAMNRLKEMKDLTSMSRWSLASAYALVGRETLLDKAGTSASVELKNTGKSTLFARIITEGIPEQGEEKAYANGVSLAVSYVDLNGSPVNVAQLEQGTNFSAVVTVKNPSARGYNNLVLSEIFPAGWEILNTRFLNESATDSLSAGVNYQDIRDDRVYSYIDRLPAGSQVTVKINLCAVYPGRFYLPPVYCEAMYDYLIRANTAGQEVTVF